VLAPSVAHVSRGRYAGRNRPERPLARRLADLSATGERERRAGALPTP